MKILHITKDFVAVNGITTFIKSLILSDNTNKHFIASNFITDDDKSIQDQKIIKQVLPLGTFQFVHNIKRVVSICKANKIDIIHSHHRYYDLLAHMVSIVYPIKTCTTVHSKVVGKKLISYKAKKIVVVGESLKQHLLKYYGINENRLFVINNFIHPKHIKLTKDKQAIKSELQLVDKYIVGFVGRFDIEEKGIDILIKSILKVIVESEDVIFVFIGEGKDEDYLINNTKMIADNVRIVKTRQDIYNYFQVFDLLVLPSRVDPFPLVMLEAAYLKVTFIGSNVDGISEIINDGINGLLFTPEDHEELSYKISYLINNSDQAKELSDRLYQKVIHNFTADVIVPQYEKLYRSLLDED